MDHKFSVEIIWKVQNFTSNWLREGQDLRSENFAIPHFSESVYFLELYHDNNNVGIEFKQSTYNIPVVEFALLDSANNPQCFGGYRNSLSYFFSEEYLLKKKNIYLPQDVLTVRCRYSLSSSSSRNNEIIYLRTIIEVNKCSFIWNIENFSSIILDQRKIKIPITLFPDLFGNERIPEVILSYVYDCATESQWIKFEVTGKITKPWFYKCKLSNLNSQTDYLLFNEVVGINHSKEWLCQPLISRESILKTVLINDVLCLNCEFIIANSKLKQYITKGSSSFIPDVDKNLTESVDTIKKPDLIKTLQQDFKEMYKKGFLQDFTLTVQSKEIHAHMSILGSRSPVFRRMIELDMKEKADRIMVIKDLDFDTTSRMLDYFYTGDPGELNENVARMLYYAGDKYEVSELKKLCSNFLKQNLSLNNVCINLELADKHQDEDLKEYIVKYILNNEKQVLSSDVWESFMKQNSHCSYNVLLTLSKMKWSK